MKALRLGLATAAMVASTSLASSAHAQTPPATADPSMSSPATANPNPVAPAAAPASPSATPTPTTEPPVETSHRTAWPWIIMGTGIALVVTAAVFQFKAVSEDDEREDLEAKLFSIPQGDSANRSALVSAINSKDDAAKSNRTTSLVIGTVGFLAIAGSVVLWFVEGGSSTPAKTAAPAKIKPSFVPAFAPGYAGAAFGASF